MNKNNKKLFETLFLSWQKLLGLFKGNAGPFISLIFKITFSVFFISASFFLLVHTFNNYLIPNIPQVLVSSPIDIISNETLLSIITLLIALAGFLAYVFRTVIQSEIKSEIHKMVREERIASQVESCITGSFIMGNLSDIAQEIKLHCIKCNDIKLSKIETEKNVVNEIMCALHDMLSKYLKIDNAINFDKINFIKINELNKENHGRVIFKAKNNYAWNIAEQQKRGGELKAHEPLIAINISNELKNLICSGEIYNYEGIKEEDVKNLNETCIEVDKVFMEEIKKIKNT